MSRERETFRLELEMLTKAYPNKHIYNRSDLMAYLGRGRCWLDSHGFTGQEYTAVDVAQKLAGIHEKQWKRRAS